MILDKYLTHEHKLYIALVAASAWIYLRTVTCYKLLPRQHISSVFLVIVWIVLYDKDPLFLPMGLITMYLYSKF